MLAPSLDDAEGGSLDDDADAAAAAVLRVFHGSGADTTLPIFFSHFLHTIQPLEREKAKGEGKKEIDL